MAQYRQSCRGAGHRGGPSRGARGSVRLGCRPRPVAATRRAAIKSLKFVPEYRAPIISALLDDESQMVKAEAARWLNNLISADVNLHGYESQYRDAPRANIGAGFRISNYDQVAEYWRNRG